MVTVSFEDKFRKTFSKIKDVNLKERIIKQIQKIRENPEIGKPMRYNRQGTRELYISPYRIVYAYQEEAITIIDFYHKDKQ